MVENVVKEEEDRAVVSQQVESSPCSMQRSLTGRQLHDTVKSICITSTSRALSIQFDKIQTILLFRRRMFKAIEEQQAMKRRCTTRGRLVKNENRLDAVPIMHLVFRLYERASIVSN